MSVSVCMWEWVDVCECLYEGEGGCLRVSV